MDVTNQQIAFTLQLKLAQAFQRFVDQLATVCHISGDAASLPLEFQEPVYGTDRLTFTDFMAPGKLCFFQYLQLITQNFGDI